MKIKNEKLTNHFKGFLKKYAETHGKPISLVRRNVFELLSTFTLDATNTIDHPTYTRRTKYCDKICEEWTKLFPPEVNDEHKYTWAKSIIRKTWSLKINA